MIGYSSLATGLTAKEKSLLGIGVFPGFRDYFNKVANDADPDATHWCVVENGGTVKVENDQAAPSGFCSCQSLAVNDNDAIACTKDLIDFNIKEPVTTIHFESRVNFDWSSNTGDVCGIGFILYLYAIVDMDAFINGWDAAAIVVHNDVPTAYSDAGGASDTTDLSAFITDNTWFDLDIAISATAVNFYINGILRATHETNVPSSGWQIAFGSTCENAANESTKVEYVEVWGE